MLAALKNSYERWVMKCDHVASKNYFTNVYGLARSLFALSLLITLVFNSKFDLFNEADCLDKASGSFGKVNLFLLFSYDNLFIAQFIAVFVLILVISGYFPRVSGVLHWWVTFSYFNATALPEGGDQAASNVTFLLIFVTLLDSRRNHWLKSVQSNVYKNFAAYLIFMLICLQVSVIYFHSAFHKLYNVEEWIDGSALYYWFHNTTYGLTDGMKTIINPVINIPIVLFIMNWGVLLLEVMLACMLFGGKKRQRKFFIYGVIFHLLIALMFGLIAFFINMSACLLLYLYPKSKIFKFKMVHKAIEFVPLSFPRISFSRKNI